MKRKKKDNKRIAYFAFGALFVIIVGAIVLSTIKNGSDIISENFLSASRILKIESVEGDKVKIFNGENAAIKSSEISFYMNNAGIRCFDIRDLDPGKPVECTLESKCQKGDVLKITYPGKSIEYAC